MTSRTLELTDIKPNDEYELVRDNFRKSIIELKKNRRIAIGPIVSIVFENRQTVTFQVQEMARAENLSSPQQLMNELRAYNPLIPAKGELSATMFLELRTNNELREWLPKLVGVETCVQFELAGGEVVLCEVDAEHAEMLTRDHTTSAVHYLRFRFNDQQVNAFVNGDVWIKVTHNEYGYSQRLSKDSKAELLKDLVD